MMRTARLFASIVIMCSAPALAQITPAAPPQPPPPPASLEPDGPGDLKVPPPPGYMPPPPPPPPGGAPQMGMPPGMIPDASLRAMVNRPVVLRLINRPEIGGTIVAFDQATVTLVTEGRGSVVTIPRGDIVELRMMQAAVAPPMGMPQYQLDPPMQAEVPASVVDEQRHFGLQFGLNPSLMLDLQYGHFYGFLNGSLVLPMASANSTNGPILGFGIGGGASWVVGRTQRWHLDLFATVTPATVGSCSNNCTFVGFGAGFGMHYTWASGFTLAWKIPVLGYAWVNHSDNFFGSSRVDSGTAVAMYYLSSIMGLPVFSLGYRF